MNHTPPKTDLTIKEVVDRTVLGVDWGERRIGVAIKPAGQDWPIPKEVLHARNQDQAVAALRRTIADSGAEAVVVGLPVHPDGRQAAAIKRFCRRTRRNMQGVRWFFVDERLTSETADSITIKDGRGRPNDDVAAALILETFIASCR